MYKHLSYEERFYIEKQLQSNVSKSAFAKALGRSRTTIHTEIRRGTVVQIKIRNRRFARNAMVSRTSQEAFLDEIRKLTDVTGVQFHIAI